MFDLRSKVAVVTGSATGIGRACALQLAREGCGVVINYTRSQTEARQTAEDVKKLGAPVLLHNCDISSDKDVREMMARAAKELGRLDILICNAGMTSPVPLRDLEAMSEDKWDRILKVNVQGTFFCVRAAAPYLRHHKRGAIVIVGARAAMTGLGSSIAYATSKGGLITMTIALARILGPDITVNMVSPGAVDTRWMAGVLGSEKWEQEKAHVSQGSALGRISTPDDVADVVLSLIGRADMVTAQNILIGADGLAI